CDRLVDLALAAGLLARGDLYRLLEIELGHRARHTVPATFHVVRPPPVSTRRPCSCQHGTTRPPDRPALFLRHVVESAAECTGGRDRWGPTRAFPRRREPRTRPRAAPAASRLRVTPAAEAAAARTIAGRALPCFAHVETPTLELATVERADRLLRLG